MLNGTVKLFKMRPTHPKGGVAPLILNPSPFPFPSIRTSNMAARGKRARLIDNEDERYRLREDLDSELSGQEDAAS